MNKISSILSMLLICFHIICYNNSEISSVYNKSISSTGLFVQESAIFIKKHALFLVAIPTSIYYNQNVISYIKNHPYITAACCYILINYICDFILNYEQQQSLLNIIELVKKTTLYLVISHGIQNHINQKKLNFGLEINDQNILNNIAENLPYSFHETTQIALKAYKEIKSCLQNLNIMFHVESEEFVFLSHAKSINIDNLLYLVQNDAILYKAIYNFEKSPQIHLIPILELLKIELTKTFIDLEKQLSLSNIQNQIYP